MSSRLNYPKIAPAAYEAMMGLEKYFDHCGLDHKLMHMIRLRCSQINGCAFCVDINSATLAQRGGSKDKVLAVAEWRRTDLFTPDERLALEYAEATSLNKVDDDLRLRLKERWGEDTIIELTGLIAYQNLSAKFNSALDVPAQGFCRLPQ
jgi:AhpD family alkylhydroperoxidase